MWETQLNLRNEHNHNADNLPEGCSVPRIGVEPSHTLKGSAHSRSVLWVLRLLLRKKQPSRKTQTQSHQVLYCMPEVWRLGPPGEGPAANLVNQVPVPEPLKQQEVLGMG